MLRNLFRTRGDNGHADDHGDDGGGPGRDGSRRWARGAALSLIGIAVLAACAWTFHSVTRSHGGCTSGPAPFGLSEDEGQCVGLTDGSYVFAPPLAGVERDIAAENKKVRQSGHYVTVALLTQFTEGPGSLITMARMKNELQGAYAAQYSADSTGRDDQGVSPPIQLVLANEGNQEHAWRRVVRQLTAMTGGPAHLVAVIGMGISDTNTIDGAKALGRAKITMVGAVITADSLDWRNFPGLTRVVPSNSLQVAALHHYLLTHGGLRKSLLVYDSDPTDLYSANLAHDFRADFGGHVPSEPYGPEAQSGNEFGLIAPNVCPDGPGAPSVVLYAGREATLQQLITHLANTPNCDGKQVTVVTASDAAALPVTATKPGEGAVTVLYSDLADTSQVTTATSTVFDQSGLGAATSRDGTWTIGTYDAMAVAARTIGAATAGSANLPSRTEVWNDIRLLAGSERVAGATGPFSISTDGEESGQDIPIVKAVDGLPPRTVEP